VAIAYNYSALNILRGDNMPENEEMEFQPRGSIIKVIPDIANRSLFGSLGQQVAEDITDINKILEKLGETDVKNLPLQVSILVHYLLRNYTTTPLGYIIDPVNGTSILKDRMLQILQLLESIVERKIRELQREARIRRKDPGFDIGQKIDDIINLHHIIMLASRESMNRLRNLQSINARPDKRPPLANVKIGYDII